MRFRASVVATTLVMAATVACTTGHATTAPLIRVGVSVPMSGPDASAGRDYRDGARVAAEVLNGQHSVRLQLPLQIDHRFRWQIQPPGSTQSATVMIGAAAETTLRLPIVDSALTSADHADNVIRVGPSAARLAAPLLDVLILRHLRASARLMVVQGDPRPEVNQEISKTIALIARDRKWVITSTTATSGDLSGPARRARNEQPDALIVTGTDVATRMLAACRQLDYAPPLVLAVGDSALTAPPAGVTAGMIRSTTWSAQVASRSTYGKQAMALYLHVTGRPMTPAAASGWTAMTILAAAASAANSSAPEEILTALHNLTMPGRETLMPWDGVRIDDGGSNDEARALAEQETPRGPRVLVPRELDEQP